MTKLRGLFTDCQEQEQPEGTYRHAVGIVNSTMLGSKENEDGLTPIGTLAPYPTIGIVPIGQDFIIFSTDDVDSEIGLATRAGDTYFYTMIKDNSYLDFDSTNPIKGEARVDVNGERIVTWTEVRAGANPPRILNIDDTSGFDDENDLLLFPDVTNPTMLLDVADSGGSLESGAYIIITKYKHIDGSTTNWCVHDRVMYVNADPITLTFDEVEGCVGGTITNKSIIVSFLGVDTRFSTLVVGYLKSINGIMTAVESREVNTAGGSVNVVITGQEDTTDLSLEEVLTPTANYNTAKAITQLDGRLYLANLTAEEIPELQKVALDIEINYASGTVSALNPARKTGNNNVFTYQDQRTFMPGEVYAFYLGVELNKGGWAYYHIPGRAPESGETDSTTDEGITYLSYQIDETADTPGADTNMGYWENQSEEYPNTSNYISALGIDLRGEKVRHHRMPSMDALMVTYTGPTVGVSSLVQLSVNATNVIIPAEIQAKIKQWKIFYAKKDQTNSLVLGSDIHQGACSAQADADVRWSSGGNWTVTPSPGTWEAFDSFEVDTLRGHSPDLLLNPTVVPAYAKFYYKLTKAGLNTQFSGFNSSGGKITTTGTDRGDVTGVVVDFTNTSNCTRSSASFFKRLDDFKFLPSNVIDGKFKTTYNEPAFVADVNNSGSDFSITADNITTTHQGFSTVSDPFTGAAAEETYFMKYFRVLSDVHTSFDNQILVPLQGSAAPSATALSDNYGGDSFITFISFQTAAPSNTNPDETLDDPDTWGTRCWKSYLGYSRYNTNMRHQVSGQLSSYYYGKTDPRSMFFPYAQAYNELHEALFRISDGMNVIEYNTDYNRVNEFTVGVVWSDTLIQETEFPNTIIWTPVQQTDSKELSWRTFLAGDTYTMPKNKGAIVNLQGVGTDTLLIHHQYSLYSTRSDIQIDTSAENAYLQSASLFTLPPKEVLPVQGGYAGTQNATACKLTKIGYAFPDDLQGKIYLYQGDSLEEISSNGMRSFFRDFMQLGANNVDNLLTYGYGIGYDEKYNRLLVSKKEPTETLSWTISYDPLQKYWTSFHKYYPYALFNTIDNVLLSTNDAGDYFVHSWLDNDSAKGVFYNDLIQHPSFVDVVFSAGGRDSLFKSVNWMTEVYPITRTSGQASSTLDYTATCTHLTLRTLTHCTGRVPLVLNNSFDSLYSSNIRNINRTWYYNDIRDIALDTSFVQGFYDDFEIDTTKLNTSMDWHEKRRFVDKYVICRFEYDNIANKRFILLDSNIVYEEVAK